MWVRWSASRRCARARGVAEQLAHHRGRFRWCRHVEHHLAPTQMQVEVVERAALLFGGGEFGQRTDSIEGQSQSNIRRSRFADAAGENLLPPDA